MKKCDKIAAFDFDGVIWDTVNECFHIGYEIFRKINGEIPLDKEVLKQRFRNGRYLAQTGDDFFITLYMIKQNPNVDFSEVSFSNYYDFRIKLKYEMALFAHEFYNERKRMREHDFDFWSSLQKPFPGVLEQLPVIRDKFRDLIICSTKDKESIDKMLSCYGQSYRVMGREVSLHKPDQMRKIADEYKIEPDKIVFVDDIMENLLSVKKFGTHVRMAGWGYNNEAERQRAEREGIKILSLGQMQSANIA